MLERVVNERVVVCIHALILHGYTHSTAVVSV